MEKFRASRLECLLSDLRYYRRMIPDIIAALATMAIVALLTIAGAML